MAQPETFYVQQAENCGKSAAAATLDNERQKFLDAQAAWQSLADATARTQAEAAKRDAERKQRLADAEPL
jgi:hypothetical protein